MPEFLPSEYDDQVFPDEYAKKEKLEGEMQADGAIHFNDKTPFILSEQPWSVPKKPNKDVIAVTLDETWSEMRTEALGRKVYYFKVYNETKAHEYTTELFEGINGEPVGRCICPAAVPCKHIKTCLRVLLERYDPTFGQAEKNSEFMVGMRTFF